MKRAAVVGAAGYAGVEAVRILLGHPGFEVTCITSSGNEGERIADLYPALSGICDLCFEPHDAKLIAQKSDVAFLAVPHTASLAMTPELVAADVQVIDLSADYRLADPEVYEAWYDAEHTSVDLLAQAVYGLPEVARDELKTAPPVVACPGCYPTASALAALPVMEAGLKGEGPITIAALSGVSGAGRKATPKTHFCNADESVGLYGLPHRHTPEIEQILGLPDHVVFTPHLAPLKRGLLSTINIPLAEVPAQELTLDMVVERYREFYEDRPFVRVLDAGQMPKTSSVAGSNACQIGLALNKTARMLVVTSAIDNLCKGAAGQAIQCANVVFGLDERRGLPLIAMPV